MHLQEICLTGQLMIVGFRGGKVSREIGGIFIVGAVSRKNVVFIVYNFFEKCLNQSLAAAFRAPNRCGLLFI
ncbi:hypothetical protein [Pseudomonas sp. GM78]|uniref:hypothetical protein n=1 Tax=Pseudomonas sp. GM78 TaxID=1144337 RepID=UPI000519A6E7|nr:hypothetical protein [Pseudomonas sp. GM78]